MWDIQLWMAEQKMTESPRGRAIGERQAKNKCSLSDVGSEVSGNHKGVTWYRVSLGESLYSIYSPQKSARVRCTDPGHHKAQSAWRIAQLSDLLVNKLLNIKQLQHSIIARHFPVFLRAII